MSIHVPENFYRQTITRAVSLTGATNIYVSTHPSPAEGYITISPSSTSLREIVYYTAKGTDGNGTYITITLANRGLGGTTAQTHAIGEAVRMNVGAEVIQEISDDIDEIVVAGAQDASTVTKGLVKLNVAPDSPTEPIALGVNGGIATSAGAADLGKIPKLNASGLLDISFIPVTTPVIKKYIYAIGGSSTTRFDITKPGGTTFRYTYDSTGTDPVVNATTIPTGTVLVIAAQNFTAANNGTFTVTGSGANYFEVTNASGVAENDKTLGTGSLKYGYTKPATLKYVQIEVVGGGGGGGGTTTAGDSGAGGGGGGSGSSDGTDSPGGAGAAGVVIITEHFIYHIHRIYKYK